MELDSVIYFPSVYSENYHPQHYLSQGMSGLGCQLIPTDPLSREYM